MNTQKKDQEQQQYTIIPPSLNERDPRPFAYRYPDSIRQSGAKFVAWIKRHNNFTNYNTLRIIESFIRLDSGRYLIPSEVLNWRRREKYQNSRIEVGNKAYFAMYLRELTAQEMKKFEEFVEDVRSVRV